MRSGFRVAAILPRPVASEAPAPVGPQPRGTPATGTGAPVMPTHQSGDVLVVWCAFAASPGNMTASGWTRLSPGNAGGGGFLYVYRKVAASAAETITLSTQPDAYLAVAVTPATGADVTGTGTAQAAPDAIAPSVTTTVAPTLLVCGYATLATSVSITAPAGQTAYPLVAAGLMLLLVAHETLLAVGATGTRTATTGGVDNTIAACVAIK